MTFTPFGELFQKAANKLNINRQLEASQIVAFARAYIKEHIPSHQSVIVRSYKNQTLHCSVNHPIIGQSLNSHRLKLIESTNNKYGNNTLTKILIRTEVEPQE